MEITLRKSKTMDESKYIYEDRTVRIPGSIRQQNKILLHSFLPFELDNNTIGSLQVLPAYTSDVDTDIDSVYVTSNTFKTLKKEITTELIKPLNAITFGCDPELFLVNKTTKQLIVASDYFRKNGQVGNDGTLLEFRPLPAMDEYILTQNIHKLILRARALVNKNVPDPKNVCLYAASYFDKRAAGFHLHFGIPLDLVHPEVFKVSMLIRLIVRVLDYYLGIMSILPEGNIDNERRTNILTDYGKPGGYRLGSVAVSYSKPTLEYRVPGGSILRHPTLTRGLIGMGALVITDIISRVKTCTKDFKDLDILQMPDQMKKLYPNLPDVEKIFKLICTKNLDIITRKEVDNIYKDFEQMVSFDEHKKSINEYLDILNTADTISNDMEENWNEH